MLGTSDAWSTSHLSQWTSVLYCRLSDFRAGISILDVGQPNFLVSLYITLDRQSLSAPFFISIPTSLATGNNVAMENASHSASIMCHYIFELPRQIFWQVKRPILFFPPFFYLWGLIKVLFPRAVNTAIFLPNVTSKQRCQSIYIRTVSQLSALLNWFKLVYGPNG